MYKVWPCPFTSTVPAPGTFLALTVIPADDDDPPDGALLDERADAPVDDDPPAAVPVEDDDPQAATVAAAPTTRPPYSSRRAAGRRREVTMVRIGRLLPASQQLNCIFHDYGDLGHRDWNREGPRLSGRSQPDAANAGQTLAVTAMDDYSRRALTRRGFALE
jgi:hypothetical protein